MARASARSIEGERSVRLSVCVRVPYPKAVPTETNIITTTLFFFLTTTLDFGLDFRVVGPVSSAGSAPPRPDERDATAPRLPAAHALSLRTAASKPRALLVAAGVYASACARCRSSRP